MKIVLKKSDRKDKKWMVRIDDEKTVHFGQRGYSDFTKHKDPKRKENYIARHRVNQNWGKSGIKTAGFWSRWILWNKPGLETSIRDTNRRFGIKIQTN